MINAKILNQKWMNDNHSNRGMDLENLINESNKYYEYADIAYIYKKPTPIGVTKVKYENGKKIIDKAYYLEKSTLDYNGLYKGKYLDFEAKTTLSNTSFPLNNIKKHQTEHIKNIIKHGGISFLIIKLANTYYYLDGNKYLEFINSNTKKSIPKSYLDTNGFILKLSYKPSLDYLKIVDTYIKENKDEKENK